MIHLREAGVRELLLDVEGATTPLHFVHSVLFPYARTHVGAFLTAHGGEPDVRSELRTLREEQEADAARGEAPPQATVAYFEWLMDRDRKSRALKSLQGRIWEAGYTSGELRGQVFQDVRASFERWSGQGFRIRIFSSGSVLAQKLLFAYSTDGDLTPYIAGYFDTAIGDKKEADSYLRIAEASNLGPSEILFLSDSIDELAAARAAGYQVVLSLREGNPPPPARSTAYDSVRSFDEIQV